MLAIIGEIGPPWGVPFVRSARVPSGISIGAFSQRSTYSMTQGHEVRVGGSASRHSSRDHVSGWACLGQEAAAGPLRHLHAEAVEGRFAGDAEGAGDVAGWPRVARC